MPIANQKLSIEIDRFIKRTNREILKDIKEKFEIDDIKPIIEMVAHARKSYIEAMLLLNQEIGNETPSMKQIEALRLKRLAFEELVSASQALDVAIERGYMDVSLES